MEAGRAASTAIIPEIRATIFFFLPTQTAIMAMANLRALLVLLWVAARNVEGLLPSFRFRTSAKTNSPLLAVSDTADLASSDDPSSPDPHHSWMARRRDVLVQSGAAILSSLLLGTASEQASAAGSAESSTILITGANSGQIILNHLSNQIILSFTFSTKTCLFPTYFCLKVWVSKPASGWPPRGTR
jgi:hypothetical protein